MEIKSLLNEILLDFDGNYKETRSYKIGQRVSIKGKVGTIIGIDSALNKYQVMINGIANFYSSKDLKNLSKSKSKANLKLKKKPKPKSVLGKK